MHVPHILFRKECMGIYWLKMRCDTGNIYTVDKGQDHLDISPGTRGIKGGNTIIFWLHKRDDLVSAVFGRDDVQDHPADDEFSLNHEPDIRTDCKPGGNCQKVCLLERSLITTSLARSQITISKNAMIRAGYVIPLAIEIPRIVSMLTSHMRARNIWIGRVTPVQSSGLFIKNDNFSPLAPLTYRHFYRLMTVIPAHLSRFSGNILKKERSGAESLITRIILPGSLKRTFAVRYQISFCSRGRRSNTFYLCIHWWTLPFFHQRSSCR